MKMNRLIPAFCTACILVVFASCAQNSPQIHAHHTVRLAVQEPDGSFSERLSLFIHSTDEDGENDFDSIRFEHLSTGLFWTLDRAGVSVRMRGKDRWLGSASLAGPGGGPVPAGEYRLTVYDLAGKEAIRSIRLGEFRLPEDSPAKLAFSGTDWTLQRSDNPGPYRRIFLYLFAQNGTLLHSWRVPLNSDGRANGTSASLKAMARDAFTVQCYVEDDTGSAAVLLTPAEIP